MVIDNIKYTFNALCVSAPDVVNSAMKATWDQVDAVTTTVSSGVSDAYDALGKTEIGRTAKNAVSQTADAVREVGSTAASTAEDIRNTVNGAGTLNAVKELLENQRRYNDILATRLAEALCRIEQLEKKVGHASNDC